jgi:hypothetical protein
MRLMALEEKQMRRIALLAVVASLFVGVLTAPALAVKPVVEEEMKYGYFYGTFGLDENIVLLAGGAAEDFCPDGFEGSPGLATSRTFVRQDGSVDVKVNDRGQPIHLYETGTLDAMAWITQVCADIFGGADAPVPFASGTANLKVRDSYLFEDGPPTHIFNSVNGRATGTEGTEHDGTEYKVRAAADIPFVDGGGPPIGDPPDWLSFDLKEIGS